MLCVCVCVCRCGDSEKTQVVRETSSNIRTLSKRLTNVATSLAQEGGGAGAEQVTAEDSEILRRDWSSQVTKYYTILANIRSNTIQRTTCCSIHVVLNNKFTYLKL